MVLANFYPYTKKLKEVLPNSLYSAIAIQMALIQYYQMIYLPVLLNQETWMS